jgi:DNA topoisomerase-1
MRKLVSGESACHLASGSPGAALNYVSDAEPGIERRRRGKGFFYTGPDGAAVSDEAVLGRIRGIVIPPAWTSVWICPDPAGHIQATGRDARGRKQYRYHPEFRAERDLAKYESLTRFAAALRGLRIGVQRDLARPGLDRRKVLATAVALLDATLLRIGNDEYARDNGSFGLTTLKRRQVVVDGAEVRFVFPGKSGKEQRVSFRHRRVAGILRKCQELPGQHLLRYRDETGAVHHVTSGDVNDYLKDATGQGFTAKTFRTWGASALMATELAALGPASPAAEAKRNVLSATKAVAARLGNTPTVCRNCYIHPAVAQSYVDGMFPFDYARRMVPGPDRRGLLPGERLLLRILAAN